jgi:hypothetical protein
MDACYDPAAMPRQVPQRNDWNGGQPIKIGEVFHVQKDQKRAVCELWTHPFGWELRLEAAGEIIQTQVCRSQEGRGRPFEQWKGAMIEKGWSDDTFRDLPHSTSSWPASGCVTRTRSR